MLSVKRMEIEDVLLLEYHKECDKRAAYYRTYSEDQMRRMGIRHDFVEEISYHPFSQGTIYGIHFQNNPKPQAKLVYCAKGRILDFAIDLRKRAGTYKHWVCAELTSENRKQLYIPAGFGHLALTMEDNVNIVMRVSEGFDPRFSRAIRYDDPEINLGIKVPAPVLSEQDRFAPFLRDADCNL